MWHINVIVNMAKKNGLFLSEELDPLKNILLKLYEDIESVESLDLGALIYMLDGIERIILLELNKSKINNNKLPLEDFSKLYVVSLIVAVKCSNEYGIWTADFIDECYPAIYDLFSSGSSLLAAERQYLQELNYELAIPLNKIGRFFDYLTDEEDQKEFLTLLKSNDLNLSLIKEKFKEKFPHYDVSPMSPEKSVKLEEILNIAKNIEIDFLEIKFELDACQAYWENKIDLKHHLFSKNKNQFFQNKINVINKLQKSIGFIMSLQDINSQSELRNSKTGADSAEVIYKNYEEIIKKLPEYKMILSKAKPKGFLSLFSEGVFSKRKKTNDNLEVINIVNNIFTRFQPMNEDSHKETMSNSERLPGKKRARQS